MLWDTWAFLESAMGGTRGLDVEALLAQAGSVVTTQHVVAETFTYLARKAGSSDAAIDWWNDLRMSRVRVLEPSLEEIHAFTKGLRQVGTLSLTDLSLGAVARSVGARAAATADREFRRMGIEPVFARA